MQLEYLGGCASASPPFDPIYIHQQRFIIQNVSTPTPDTRPTVVFWSLHQARTHRILMGVVNSLLQYILRQQQSRVGMVIPKRMTVVPRPDLVPQFLQRDFMVVIFQIVDYAMTSNSINELKRSGGREHRVCNDMQMIRHNHISIQGKLARPPRLAERCTSDELEFIRAKNRRRSLVTEVK